MNTSKKLLRSDIRYECGDSSYERGRSYFENGRVVYLAIKNEGTLFVQLNALVKGSGSNPYQQNIRIVWRPDYSAAEIEGDCSCPVGYNCKHVAAACLMYQNSNQTLSSSPGTGSDCLGWLESLNEQLPLQHDTSRDFIAYILKPANTKYEFTVDFLITKEKNPANWVKGENQH